MKYGWKFLRQLLVGPISAALYLYLIIGYGGYRLLGQDNIIARMWLFIVAGPFLVLNALYNIIIGTFIWLDLPRELAYTQRITRYVKQGDKLAKWIAITLNEADPNHVKLVPNDDNFEYRWKMIRHLLVGPISFVMLVAFGLYFWGLRTFGHTVLKYPWALLVGLPMGIMNFFYNTIIGTFIWLDLPREGGYTGRIKRHQADGNQMADHLARMINEFDPDHFNV